MDEEVIPRTSRSGNGWQVGQDEDERDEKARKEEEERNEAEAPPKPDFDEMVNLIAEGETLPIDYTTNLKTFRLMKGKVMEWQAAALEKLRAITQKCVSAEANMLFEEAAKTEEVQETLQGIIDSAENLEVQTKEER